MNNSAYTFRALRATAGMIERGQAEQVALPGIKKSNASAVFGMSLVAALAYNFFTGKPHVLGPSLTFAISLGLLAYLWPLLAWLVGCIGTRRVNAAAFTELSDSQQLWYGALLWMAVYEALSYLKFFITGSHFASGVMALVHLVVVGLVGAFGTMFVMTFLKARQARRSEQPIAPVVKGEAINPASLPFGLWLGKSTGTFSALSHGAGISAGQNVGLSLEDAAQNVLILGGIGSGKTTRAIQPVLVQLFDQDAGGLIFDIKGDFKKAVSKYAAETGRSVTIIGPHQKGLNLLAGLTPEVAASFLKSAFLLGGGGRGDAFWMDTATELCRNALGVLSFLPGNYSLEGLHRYLYDPAEREELDAKALDLLQTLDERQARLLKSYQGYHENIFSKFDDKVIAGVNATVAQVLAPFNHPDLVDAFCSENADMARMESVLEGAVFLVDMPLSVWGLGGKVAYTFIKLRLFNVMQRRATMPDWNQDRPVFFMCDEYQEIISANKDGLSDLSFWDKSRSSKTIGIISMQSVSSAYAAIGNHDLANAVLQNFRQKLCFRTEDQATLDQLNRLVGRVEVAKRSFSAQQGTSSGSGPLSSSTNESSGETVTFQEKNVLDAQLVRNLGENQVIALLSIGGHSMDDVLDVVPAFV